MIPFNIIGTQKNDYENAQVGEKFGPYTYPVDDFSVKLFAFAQDDYNSWSFSDNNPFGKRIAQASYFNNDLLHVFFTHYDPNYVVGLHTQEELWFHNPAFVGENVTITAEYVDKYVKRGKGYVELRSEVVGADGRKLVTHQGAEIMRIMGSELSGKKTVDVVGEKVTGEFDESLIPAKVADENIIDGTPIEPLEKTTTTYQTQAFSWGGMFFDTIHSNINIAKASGYDSIVVQGQQQVSYITEMLVRFFGESWYTSGHEKIKILKPSLAGEKLVFRGIVKRKENENGKVRLHLHVWGKDSKGDMTVCGWASALV